LAIVAVAKAIVIFDGRQLLLMSLPL